MIRVLRSKFRKKRIFSDLEQAIVGCPLRIESGEGPWFFFGLDEDLYMRVETLWRLVGASYVCVTSEDDGHQFGLPAPVDAAKKANGLLAGSAIESVSIRSGSGDLVLKFANGFRLEVITTSMGYESWELYRAGETIAVGSNGGLI